MILKLLERVTLFLSESRPINSVSGTNCQPGSCTSQASVHEPHPQSGSCVTGSDPNEVACVTAAGEYTSLHRGAKKAGKSLDLQARYWSYLFDNLHRAVDEIYCTCEADESILECEVSCSPSLLVVGAKFFG